MSIREADWRAENQPFPLSHHPRWMLTHIPALVHYRQEREKLQELKLRRPNVFALDDFVRLTLAGDEYDGDSRSSRAADWSLPPPVKLNERSSRVEQYASLLFQLESHRTSAEQLNAHKTRLDQDITALQQLIGSLDPGAGSHQAPTARRLPCHRKRASFVLPDAPGVTAQAVLRHSSELARSSSTIEEESEASFTCTAEAADASLNSRLASMLASCSVKEVVAVSLPEAEALLEHGRAEPDAVHGPAGPVCDQQSTKHQGCEEEGDLAKRQPGTRRRRSTLDKLVSMAGSKITESLSSLEGSSHARSERGLPRNPLALPSDEVLYEEADQSSFSSRLSFNTKMSYMTS